MFGWLHLGVSWNGDTPKSSILEHFGRIIHEIKPTILGTILENHHFNINHEITFLRSPNAFWSHVEAVQLTDDHRPLKRLWKKWVECFRSCYIYIYLLYMHRYPALLKSHLTIVVLSPCDHNFLRYHHRSSYFSSMPQLHAAAAPRRRAPLWASKTSAIQSR